MVDNELENYFNVFKALKTGKLKTVYPVRFAAKLHFYHFNAGYSACNLAHLYKIPTLEVLNTLKITQN